MAYLHCHSCGWSQDDFWYLRFRLKWYKWRKSFWKLGFDLGYNPISKMVDIFKWLVVPHWIAVDKWLVDDLHEYTGVKVRTRTKKKVSDQRNSKIRNSKLPVVFEYEELQVFSWSWLWLEIVKEWKTFNCMKWWTWKSWKKNKDTAVCPHCGKRNFDID